jgi:hypothetical protein
MESKKIAWKIMVGTLLLIALAVVYIIIPAIIAGIFSLVK